MAEANEIVLSGPELEELIERESKARLGLSAKEFLHQWRAGDLPDSIAVREIGMLASLADRNGKTVSLQVRELPERDPEQNGH